MSALKIRKGELKDLDALVEFNQSMALETEDKLLDESVLRQGVTAVLKSNDKGFYLVVEQDGEVGASLMVTFEWSDWRNQVFWWVQSVYVRPVNRRQGLYRALYSEVKRLAQEDGNVCGFRLYVEKENRVAQQTYEELGMAEAVYFMFEEKLD